jgi:sugar lactone lactonase YvrE
MTTHILRGTVQSGGTTSALPLADALVTLYEATANIPLELATARTDIEGNFSLDISRNTSDSIFYATARLGDGLHLLTIVGQSIPASITINELTTVAAAFSTAQFAHDGVIAGDPFGLRIASGMSDNLVSPLTGASSEVLLSSPNGDETNSLRSTRALANLLAACVQKQPCAAATLLVLATPPHGDAPDDTFEALVNIARHPANNVVGIYTQSKAREMYLPSLEKIPDAWTIAVKVNDSGSDEMLFGGPANIVFDHKGYAWVTNNVVQGTPDSARCIMVLKPDGKPADGENGTPKSPITGGGLLGTGFGIDIDRRGSVWVGNFGWGGSDYNPSPDGTGSVSQFDALGQPISGDEGYQGGTNRAQGVVSDEEKNIWIASYDNNKVVVFPDGDPSRSFHSPEPDGKCPFDIAIAQDGSAWVTNSGGLRSESKSSVHKYVLENGALVRQFSVEIGHSLKGMSLDSQGNAWIASGGDDVVYLFSPEGEMLGEFGDGGISCPWSATVDGDDNVWVANFGPMKPGSDYTYAAISKLAGANPETRPPGFKTGDPISPQTGYTLPSGGSQVRLHNGEPLYGRVGPPSYSPLMRQTNCVIDQAGNVWAINNWKPNFNLDAPPHRGNPGGDGIVIFVGLAKPPIKKH